MRKQILFGGHTTNPGWYPSCAFFIIIIILQFCRINHILQHSLYIGIPPRLYMPDGYHPIVELLNECDCCTKYTSEELQDYEIVEMGLNLCICE